MDDAKYTVEWEETYIIAANPSPEVRAQNAKADQSWKDGVRKRQEGFHKRADGRKLLRLSSRIGPCLVQGIVVRETAQFYVYAEGAHSGDGLVEDFPLRRKRKDSAHVESCRCCEDHPMTNFPMGWLS